MDSSIHSYYSYQNSVPENKMFTFKSLFNPKVSTSKISSQAIESIKKESAKRKAKGIDSSSSMPQHLKESLADFDKEDSDDNLRESGRSVLSLLKKTRKGDEIDRLTYYPANSSKDIRSDNATNANENNKLSKREFFSNLLEKAKDKAIRLTEEEIENDNKDIKTNVNRDIRKSIKKIKNKDFNIDNEREYLNNYTNKDCVKLTNAENKVTALIDYSYPPTLIKSKKTSKTSNNETNSNQENGREFTDAEIDDQENEENNVAEDSFDFEEYIYGSKFELLSETMITKLAYHGFIYLQSKDNEIIPYNGNRTLIYNNGFRYLFAFFGKFVFTKKKQEFLDAGYKMIFNADDIYGPLEIEDEEVNENNTKNDDSEVTEEEGADDDADPEKSTEISGIAESEQPDTREMIQLQNEIVSLKNELESVYESRDFFQSKCEQLEQVNSVFEKAALSNDGQGKKNINQELKSLKFELSESQKEARNYKRQLEKTIKELNKTVENQNYYKNELKTMKQKLSGKKIELSNKKTELHTSNFDLNVALKQVLGFKSKLLEMNVDLRITKMDHRSVIAECDRLMEDSRINRLLMLNARENENNLELKLFNATNELNKFRSGNGKPTHADYSIPRVEECKTNLEYTEHLLNSANWETKYQEKMVLVNEQELTLIRENLDYYVDALKFSNLENDRLNEECTKVAETAEFYRDELYYCQKELGCYQIELPLLLENMNEIQSTKQIASVDEPVESEAQVCKAELEVANIKLETFTNEFNSFKIDFDEVLCEMDKVGDELRVCQEELIETKKTNEEYKNELVTEKETARLYKADLEQFQTKCQDLERDLISIQVQLNRKNKMCQELKAKSEVCELNMELSKEACQKLNTELEAEQLKALDYSTSKTELIEVNKYKKELEEKNQYIKDIEKINQDLRTKFVYADIEIKKYQDEIASNKVKLEEKLNMIETASEELKASKNEIIEIKSKLVLKENDYNKLQDQKKLKEEDLEVVKRALLLSEEDYKKAIKENMEINENYNNIKKELEDAKETIKITNNELVLIKFKLSTSKNENKLVKNEYDAAMKQFAELAESSKQESLKLKKEQKSFNLLKEEAASIITRYMAENEVLEEENVHIIDENDRLNTVVEKFIENNKLVEQSIDGLKSVYDNKVSEFKTLANENKVMSLKNEELIDNNQKLSLANEELVISNQKITKRCDDLGRAENVAKEKLAKVVELESTLDLCRSHLTGTKLELEINNNKKMRVEETLSQLTNSFDELLKKHGTVCAELETHKNNLANEVKNNENSKSELSRYRLKESKARCKISELQKALSIETAKYQTCFAASENFKRNLAETKGLLEIRTGLLEKSEISIQNFLEYNKEKFEEHEREKKRLRGQIETATLKYRCLKERVDRQNIYV